MKPMSNHLLNWQPMSSYNDHPRYRAAGLGTHYYVIVFNNGFWVADLIDSVAPGFNSIPFLTEHANTAEQAKAVAQEHYTRSRRIAEWAEYMATHEVPPEETTCCAGGPQWGHTWECPKCPD